jgi:murein DD-endopeptidase MepM/ murein hydrolase activator NlpD
MGRGALSALNSFAGGLASGLATGTRMRSEMEAAERDREKFEWEKKDRKTQDDIDAELSAASAAPVYTGSNFDDQGFADENEARANLPRPPQAAPDTASTQAAMGMPADPLAALPDGPQGGMPSQQPSKQPQMVTMKDRLTGRWHNVPAERVRPPNDTDIARTHAEILMKHGKVEDAYKLMHQFFTTKAAQIGVEREDLSDQLTRNVMNPEGLAKVATRMMDQFGTDFEVTPVMVPAGDGKQYPVLALNKRGTNAPPMYLDQGPDGSVSLSTKPSPGIYGRQAAMLIGMAKGDLAGAMAQVVATEATLTNMAATRQRTEQDRQAFPLEQEQRRANISSTKAGTESARVNTSRTRQAIGIDANQDTRAQGEYDATYGAGGFFQSLTTVPGGQPGALRDGGTRTHKGRDYSGISEGTPIPAPGDAVLIDSGADAKSGNWGKWRLPNGSTFSIAHLAEAPSADPVKKGQPLAVAGNTGNASTRGTSRAVLHVRTWDSRGKEIDPNAVFRPGPNPKQQRELAGKATERLAKIKDTALKMAAQTAEPNTPEFNQALIVAMAAAVRGEPQEVQDAFRQQYNVNTSLMQR